VVSSSGFVTDPVSSTGDDKLDDVFGRDMAVIFLILSERRTDASQEAMDMLYELSMVG
jgi:hypothetical protein